jgi:hypothetical protein
MKRWIPGALAALLLLPCAFAQTGYVTMTAANLIDQSGGGATITNATATFCLVNAGGTPIGVHIGSSSGGQAAPRCLSVPVSSGVLTGTLVDTNLSNPQNPCYQLTVTDNTSGDLVLGGPGSGYSCLQPQWTESSPMSCVAGVCSLDSYTPTGTPGLMQAVGAAGPAGPQGLSGSVSATGAANTLQRGNGAGGLSTTPAAATADDNGKITSGVSLVTPLGWMDATNAPGYASGSAYTTTTSGTTAAGTAVTVAACGDFAVATAGVRYGHEGVLIAGAGVSGADYLGTVTTCSGTSMVVTPATSTSVSSGALVEHDDGAALQALVTNAGGVPISLPTGTYRVNGQPQAAAVTGSGAITSGSTTAAFNTNLAAAQDYWDGGTITFTSGVLSGQTFWIVQYGITAQQILPLYAAASAPSTGDTFTIATPRSVVVFPGTGLTTGNSLPLDLEGTPATVWGVQGNGGTTIMRDRPFSTPGSVLGGWAAPNYLTLPLLNTILSLNNLSFQSTATNPAFEFVHGYNVANMKTSNLTFGNNLNVNLPGSQPTSQAGIGMSLPMNLADAMAIAKNVTVQEFYTGLIASEHTSGDDITCDSVVNCIALAGNSGHGMNFGRVDVQWATSAFYAAPGAHVSINVELLTGEITPNIWSGSCASSGEIKALANSTSALNTTPLCPSLHIVFMANHGWFNVFSTSQTLDWKYNLWEFTGTGTYQTLTLPTGMAGQGPFFITNTGTAMLELSGVGSGTPSQIQPGNSITLYTDQNGVWRGEVPQVSSLALRQTAFTSSTTLTANYGIWTFTGSAAATLTLPSPTSAMGSAGPYWVFNDSNYPLTISGGTWNVPTVLYRGQTTEVYVNSNNWWALNLWEYIDAGTPYTVSTLPTCNNAARDRKLSVTDATTPTFLGTLTGGGSTYTPVVCNGSAWVAY